jgi:lipopolysaccharide export LptBFGC system permease protein LptF
MVYQAYIYPAANTRSRKILSNVIFARDYESYKDFFEKDTADFRDEKMKSLPELIGERKKPMGKEKNIGLSDITGDLSPVRPDRNTLEFARRFVFPTQLFLFWISGLLLARSFRGAHRIFPFLIALLITPVAWVSGQLAGELAAKRGDTTIFWGVFRLEIVLALFCVAWYFLLEKFQGPRKEAGNESVEETGEKNGKNGV